MLRIYYPGPYSDKLQTTTSFSKRGSAKPFNGFVRGRICWSIYYLDSTLTKTAPGGDLSVCHSLG